MIKEKGRLKTLCRGFQTTFVVGQATLFLVFLDNFFEVWHGAVAALAAAVGENNGRRAVEAELFAQRSGLGLWENHNDQLSANTPRHS